MFNLCHLSPVYDIQEIRYVIKKSVVTGHFCQTMLWTRRGKWPTMTCCLRWESLESLTGGNSGSGRYFLREGEEGAEKELSKVTITE